jgi:intracellular septation protein A
VTAETAQPTGSTQEIRDLFGGRQGFLDSGLPAVVFVAVNAWRGLTEAMLAAIAFGALLLGLRLARKESPRHAVNGFVGIAFAAGFARMTGEAKNFFLPGILLNLAYGSALLGSVALRRPLFAVLFKQLTSHPDAWHADPRTRRALRDLTLAWGAFFAARFVSQVVLYALDRPGWLVTVRFVGAGVFALLAVWTLPFVERRTSGVVVPEDAPAEPAVDE